MYKLDIKIMAVESRKKFAEHVLDRVKENDTAQICYDPSGKNGSNNPWQNARRVWSMEPADGCGHRLVLQDDIEVVDNFLYYVDKCITFQPDAVWTYYMGMDGERVIKHSPFTPFVKIRGCRTGGPAILMPVKYIEPMIKETDIAFGTKFKGDDVRIGWWCAMNRISMFTTNPALVQHRAIKSTVKGHTQISMSRKWVGRDISHLNINFDAKTYTVTNKIYPYLWRPEDNNELDADKAKEYCNIAKNRVE